MGNQNATDDHQDLNRQHLQPVGSSRKKKEPNHRDDHIVLSYQENQLLPSPTQADGVKKQASFNRRKQLDNRERSVLELEVGEKQKPAPEADEIMKSFLHPKSPNDETKQRTRSPSRSRPPSPSVSCSSRKSSRSPSYPSSPVHPSHSMEANGKAQQNSLDLSSAQINLIRKAWHSARSKGALEPGLTIFQHIFFLSHDVRSVFGFGGNYSEQQYHIRFKGHARIFTEMFDELIANLEQDHLVTPRIKKLGQQHAHFREVGFKIVYWDTFARALIDCTLDWGKKSGRNHETQVAWTQIVMYIIDKMKDGYYEEMRRMKRGSRQLVTSPVRFKEEATGLEERRISDPLL